MASQIINLEVVSPSKPVAKVKARSVNLPGALGYMTVLPGHARMISEVDTGKLTVEKVEVGEPLQYFISGGYICVEGDNVIVLADTIETPAEINKSRAEESRQRALTRLTNVKDPIDLERAQRAFKRAEARITIAQG